MKEWIEQKLGNKRKAKYYSMGKFKEFKKLKKTIDIFAWVTVLFDKALRIEKRRFDWFYRFYRFYCRFIENISVLFLVVVLRLIDSTFMTKKKHFFGCHRFFTIPVPQSLHFIHLLPFIYSKTPFIKISMKCLKRFSCLTIGLLVINLLQTFKSKKK